MIINENEMQEKIDIKKKLSESLKVKLVASESKADASRGAILKYQERIEGAKSQIAISEALQERVISEIAEREMEVAWMEAILEDARRVSIEVVAAREKVNELILSDDWAPGQDEIPKLESRKEFKEAKTLMDELNKRELDALTDVRRVFYGRGLDEVRVPRPEVVDA